MVDPIGCWVVMGGTPAVSEAVEAEMDSGLVTFSILFWLFTINDQVLDKCVFHKRTIKVCVSYF